MQNSCAAELIYALPFNNRLVVNRREAASLLGLSTGHFDKLVRQGYLPCPLPIPGVRRWDKRDIQSALDALSGRGTRDDNHDDLDRELAEFEAQHGYN
jgi:predicted DNA-binding transcriptional regulator AlpA